MKVSQIVKLIIEEINTIENGEWFTPEDLYKRLGVYGPDNKHLVSPLSQGPNTFYWVERETALTGNEGVKGDYLLFQYSEHQGDMWLWQYESLQTLESAIIGGGGILNYFTTHMVAIIKGKIWRYEVWAVKEGSIQRVRFDKRKQLHFGNWHSPKLTWL